MTIQEHELLNPPPISRTNSSLPPETNPWSPYSSAGDFTAHMAAVLAALLFSLLLLIATSFLVRSLRRRFRHQRDIDKLLIQMELLETVVFPSDALAEKAECAICLTEFADGDVVHVISSCNHGFHVKCVEKWLSRKLTCPTCRCSCRVDQVTVEVGEEEKRGLTEQNLKCGSSSVTSDMN